MSDVKEPKDTSKEPGGEKLIYGKYKTQEEADKGFAELQKYATEKAQEAARNKEALEQLLEPATKPVAKADDTDKGDDGMDDETFAQRFMENPRKFLKQVREETRREAVAEAAQHNELYLATREFIGKFLDDNQDVRQNSKLFTMHLAGTNPKEKLGERLEAAAKMTRDEVTRIKEDVRKATDFQKGQVKKAGSVEGDGETIEADVPKKDEKEDDSFDSYMKERKAEHAKFTSLV